MRRGPVLAAAVLAVALSACSKPEPDFDERYQAANARISKAAEEIDARIAASEEPQEVPPSAAP